MNVQSKRKYEAYLENDHHKQAKNSVECIVFDFSSLRCQNLRKSKIWLLKNYCATKKVKITMKCQ